MDDLQPFDRRGRELGLAARPLLVLSGCRSWENHINKNQTKNHLHRFLYKPFALSKSPPSRPRFRAAAQAQLREIAPHACGMGGRLRLQGGSGMPMASQLQQDAFGILPLYHLLNQPHTSHHTSSPYLPTPQIPSQKHTLKKIQLLFQKLCQSSLRMSPFLTR